MKIGWSIFFPWDERDVKSQEETVDKVPYLVPVILETRVLGLIDVFDLLDN